MNNLIDYTWFEYENDPVRGINVLATDNKRNPRLDEFVSRYQEEYLRKLLGDDLYEAFDAGFSVGSPDQKWTDLANQIRNTTTKVSCMTGYIFNKYMSFPLYTAQNQRLEVDQEYICKSWNRMVDLVDLFIDWINENAATYNPEITENPFETINIFNI